MVLCRDEAAMRGRVYARLVVTTVTISEGEEGGGKGRREKENGREKVGIDVTMYMYITKIKLKKITKQRTAPVEQTWCLKLLLCSQHDNNDVIMTSDDCCSLHFEGAGSDGSGEQLVAETNPKKRLGILGLEVGADVVNSQSAKFRVSWAIAEEETVQF